MNECTSIQGQMRLQKRITQVRCEMEKQRGEKGGSKVRETEKNKVSTDARTIHNTTKHNTGKHTSHWRKMGAATRRAC